MKDQATPERLLLVLITRTRCSMLHSRDDSHSLRMHVVSKVITVPGGVARPGTQA